MIDVIIDALVDSFKLLPFLFIVYLIMEYLEHKTNNKTENVIKRSGRFGPIIGSILGAFPQCGFSVMASNLYFTKIISMGTLIAIFLSTSDEMLPVMISNGISFDKIIKIVLLKVIIGMLFGFIIDLFVSRKKNATKTVINKMCEHDHCHCEKNIFISSIKHALNIFVFIVFVNLILNFLINSVGENFISGIFVNNKIIGPIVSGFVGLIPNCATSVVITELFINGTINFGTLMAGLMINSGVALIVLFRLNKNLKENITIISLTYLIAVSVGIVINLLNISV